MPTPTPSVNFRRAAVPYLEACEFGFAEPEWFPIGGEAGDESLSLALAALTGLGENESAFVQLLARPVISWARYRLVRAARVLRAGGRPGRVSWRVGRGGSGHRPAPDPTVEGDVRAILSKAASPLWSCTLRVAVVSDSGEQARGRIHGLAGAFAVFEGRNGFRRRRRTGQSLLTSSPFEYVDMSVKEPWDAGWKEKVRSRIRGCN